MDEQELKTALLKARGYRFTELFREADASIGERLRTEIRARGVENLSILDVAKMAVREGLPLKTLCRMVEDKGCLPTGWHDQAKRCVNLTELMERARAEQAAQP